MIHNLCPYHLKNEKSNVQKDGKRMNRFNASSLDSDVACHPFLCGGFLEKEYP